MCSKHLVNGEPIVSNPNPTLFMVYETENREILLSPLSRKKKRKLMFEVKTKARHLRSCKSLRSYENLLKTGKNM